MSLAQEWVLARLPKPHLETSRAFKATQAAGSLTVQSPQGLSLLSWATAPPDMPALISVSATGAPRVLVLGASHSRLPLVSLGARKRPSVGEQVR